MADDRADDGTVREGGGPAQSSMTIRVYKTGPDGRQELVQARIVGPREQLALEEEPLRYPTCVCPTCRSNGTPAAEPPLRAGE